MMSRISHLVVALILGSIFLFLLVVLPVRAVNLTVLNTNDSGPGSLREAIVLASDDDTILFDSSLNGQTIILTSGQLLITKNLTISGPGANLLAISGNNVSRVFSITSIVTISGVTIKDGTAVGGGGIYNDSGFVNLIYCTVFDNTSIFDSVNLTGGFGGGIANNGTINLTNSTVSSNTAGNVSSFGGGIYNFFNGTVNLTNSTVSSNTAFSGGGIYNASGVTNLTNSAVSSNTVFFNDGGGITILNGEANLTNSTVSGNTAARSGGGMYSLGTANLTNSTVSSNNAGNDGGGLYNAFGTTTLTNTILAYNRVSFTASDCTNLSGTVTSRGHNLVQTPNNCVFSATGDITNTNPLLGPLADNGGDTLTHALLYASPAIDKIPNGSIGCGTTITTDQRGVVRPQGMGCDIGAYELGYLYLPLILSN